MTNVLCSRIVLRNRQCLRCLYSTDPQDTIGPPTKAWRYLINRFSQLVDKYENRLEKKAPKTFNVYKTIKSVRYIASDTKDYLTVTRDMWSGRELHTFSRRELEIYQELPKDMLKIVSLLLLASIPFVGNLFVIIGYMYPRTLFTHHLWNDKQKVEFGQHLHARKLSHYHNVLEHMDKQVQRHTHGKIQDHFSRILDKLQNSSHPTTEELLWVKHQFESFPFSIEVLPTVYFRHLAAICDFTKRRLPLKQDGLIMLHIDRAMVREGIENMTEQEVCKSCLKRGLNPYGLDREERIKFLQEWTELSKHLDENSVSLLLHCPVLLTYNKQTNIQLMKGKRYKWRKKKSILGREAKKSE